MLSLAVAAADLAGSPHLPVARQIASGMQTPSMGFGMPIAPPRGFVLHVASPRPSGMVGTSSADLRQHPLQVSTTRSPRLPAASHLAAPVSGMGTSASSTTVSKTPYQAAWTPQPQQFASSAHQGPAAANWTTSVASSTVSGGHLQPAPHPRSNVRQYAATYCGQTNV